MPLGGNEAAMAKQTRPSSRADIWLIVGALPGLLALAALLLHLGWNTGELDPAWARSSGGYAALTLGILALVSLGAGLVTLICCNNNHRHRDL
jgi:hypothetical protein